MWHEALSNTFIERCALIQLDENAMLPFSWQQKHHYNALRKEAGQKHGVFRSEDDGRKSYSKIVE